MNPPVHTVEIIGHRGAAHDAPENTMASFRLAWNQGADAVELDVRLSKDGRIVVIHDADTRRTTGRKGRVARKTIAELHVLDAGSWKGSDWSGERIPTLDEVVAAIPAGRRLFIEIKCGPEIAPELERVLRASGKHLDEIVVIGFKLEVLHEVKKRMPELAVCWIVSRAVDRKTRRRPVPASLIDKAANAGMDGLDLDGKFPIDSVFVTKANAAGLKLYVWTVDDPKTAAHLAEAGVDGITTNRPGWLRERLVNKP